MHEKNFEAFFFAPHRVLKRDLRPFTVRHAFLLGVAQNPFWIGGIPAPSDLAQAVEICAASPFAYDDGSPSGWRVAITNARSKRADAIEYARFQCYLDDYATGPSLWQPGDALFSQAPTEISIWARLRLHYGLGDREAWEVPLGQALWLTSLAQESVGAVKPKFMGSDELEFVEEYGNKAD